MVSAVAHPSDMWFQKIKVDVGTGDSLSAALNQVRQKSGVRIAADADLGLDAFGFQRAVRGSFYPFEAICRILAGSAFVPHLELNDSVIIHFDPLYVAGLKTTLHYGEFHADFASVSDADVGPRTFDEECHDKGGTLDTPPWIRPPKVNWK